MACLVRSFFAHVCDVNNVVSHKRECKMFKHMLLGLGAASLLAVTAMPVQAAAILPDGLSDLIVTGKNRQWEWVWVSPCFDVDGGKCSFKDGVEAYGFALPDSVTQWTDSFDGFRDGSNSMVSAFTFISSSGTPTPICATSYFSQDYTECNPGDLNQGFVWQAPFDRVTADTTVPDPTSNLNAEVFWVRKSVNSSVPEPPSSLPEPSSLLLLGAGLLGLAAWRWKHTA